MEDSLHYRLRTCHTNCQKAIIHHIKQTTKLRPGEPKILEFLAEHEPCEQKKIAAFLDAKCSEIDALVADIQAQIEMLEQYKRSTVIETVTKGLNSNITMKDSGVQWIGKIPETWDCIRGKYILKYIYI